MACRGVGEKMEKELGLPDMRTAPPYKESDSKATIPGKEGGDNMGMHTNKMKIGKPK